LKSFDPANSYPQALRRIRSSNAESEKNLILLTNHFLLPTLTIPQLYKCRWRVELFFK
jgi:IS4 transposase